MNRLLLILSCIALSMALPACSDRSGGPAAPASAPAEPALPLTMVIDGQDCLTDVGLRQRGWPLVEREVWEALPRQRDWAAIAAARAQARERDGLPLKGVDAVYFQGRERVIGMIGWREPRPVCVQVRDGEAWAALIDERFKERPSWYGPMVATRDFNTLDVSYYNRIFGTVCYDDEKKEHWCFAPAALIVNGKPYTATLQLDRTNMPNYGTPVRVEGQAGYWIFVPVADGWKVYRDDDVTTPGHRDINPERDPPWHTLRVADR